MIQKHEVDGRAHLFDNDVDSLRAGVDPPHTGDAGYDADLALAQTLAGVRTRPDARFESRLRNHLLAELYRQQEGKMESRNSGFRSWLRPLAMATVAAVMLFGMMLVVSPDARAAAGGLVTRFVAAGSAATLPKAAQVGSQVVAEPAVVGQTAAGTGGVAASGQPAGAVSDAQSPVGALGQAPLPKKGVPPVLPSQPEVAAAQQLISLKDAQAQGSFQIKVPSMLPSGYQLLGVVAPPAAPTDLSKGAPPPPAGALGAPDAVGKAAPPPPMPNVILVFGNQAGDRLMLSESRTASLGGLEMTLTAPNAVVRDVTVNGQPAQYLATGGADSNSKESAYQLHWQTSDGTLCDLTSLKLGLSDLLAVANSIK